MATSESKLCEAPCPKCKGSHLTYQIWESSDGAFEDTHYECPDCGANWWVDGPDA